MTQAQPSFGSVKLLQKRTGATFADCKAALLSACGDEDAAARLLGSEHAEVEPLTATARTRQTAVAGLLVLRIEGGDGQTFPQPGDRVAMHYRGTLVRTGTEFDSSYRRGRPFEFTVGSGEVIRGWDEGVLQLSLGEKAELVMGPEYAYGEEGAGDAVPPRASLKFEVCLVRLERAGSVQSRRKQQLGQSSAVKQYAHEL